MTLEHDNIVGTQCCDNTVPRLVRPDPRVRQRILSSRYVQIYWNGPHCVSRVVNKTNKSNRGHMCDEDENTLLKCTVCGFHTFHKWSGGVVPFPSLAMELQEMGVDGQVSTEPVGSNDDKIFFMKYPLPFLR